MDNSIELPCYFYRVGGCLKRKNDGEVARLLEIIIRQAPSVRKQGNKQAVLAQKAASTNMDQIGATLAGNIAALFLYVLGPNHFFNMKKTLLLVVIS
jgi:hypothetical protein